MIDRFVSIITLSTSAVLLHLVYSCFDIVLIALFCVAVRRYSLSLLRFLFLSYVKVFFCEISFVCLLKCPYSCFYSHFFLVIFVMLMLVSSVLFLVAVISLPPCFFLCSLLVFKSMHRRFFECWRVLVLLLFLTHSQSTASMRCQVLCIVTGFIVLSLIC